MCLQVRTACWVEGFDFFKGVPGVFLHVLNPLVVKKLLPSAVDLAPDVPVTVF